MALTHIALPVFEGPLDLLLHLIQKNELDITAISLSEITAQYLDCLDLMQEFNLDVASEFVVVAAELARLKSRSLLPASDADDGEDEEELFDGQGLLKRLIDYQRFKRAAQALGIRPQLEVDLFRRGGSDLAFVAPDPLAVPVRKEEAGKLLYLYRELLRRKGRVSVHRVALENVSVRQKMIELLDAFKARPALRLSDLIAETRSRMQKVAVFLAVLELLRLRLLRLSQAESGETEARAWTLARGEAAAVSQLDHYEEDFRS